MSAAERWRARWYSRSADKAVVHGPVQTEDRVRSAADGRQRMTLPMPILEQAWKEYDDQGHGGQSLERLNERSGFGILEVVYLLADRCERLEHRAGGPR